MGSAFAPSDLPLLPDLLDRYVELGGNVIDTARSYGSEETVGRWLAGSGVRRDALVLITKGAHPPLDDYARSRVSPEAIDEDLARSIDALGVDTIDLYFLHRDDPSVAVGPLLEALERHRLAGRIRSYGASNWSIARLEDAERYARDHGLAGFVASSPHLSLAVPAEPAWPGGVSIADAASRAWHAGSQLAVFAWSALSRGWFADEQTFDVNWSAADARRVYDTPHNRERRERARRLGAELGLATTSVALAWIFHQPFPAWAVVGPHTTGELEASAVAAAVELTPAQVADLEAASGG